MNKICTSIEQSQKLMELGVDVNTADMYWWYYGKNSGKRYYVGTMDDNDFIKESDIPAWSLSALLKLMPKSIISTPNPFSDNYCCRNVEFDMEFYADNPVDAAFETLSWLLENKKL